MTDKTILSLFDYSGSWSAPYRDAGYKTIQIDIKLDSEYGNNIYTLDVSKLPKIHGILAAPPCTDFSSSGARWWQAKDNDGSTFESIAIVYKTLSIIWQLKHRDNIAWWVLENPVGRITKMVPELAKYGPHFFNPNQFGDPYTKKTGLYGEFVFPDPLWIGGDWTVPATEGSQMWAKYGGKSERTKTARSITPSGFSKAFHMTNP